MCASPGSPHRLTSAWGPARKRSPAATQAFASTLFEVELISAEERRDVLEPGDERRRQPDAGDQHQREMQADRQERSLRGIAAAIGIAKREPVQPQEQGAKPDEQAQAEDE